MVVDDEHDNSSIFTIGLQNAGFEVDVYNDPELALSAFKPDYYDLLIAFSKDEKPFGVSYDDWVAKYWNKRLGMNTDQAKPKPGECLTT